MEAPDALNMVPSIAFPAVAVDILQCMGLGLIASLLRCLLPYGRRPCFFADFLCTGVLLILLQAFAASRSAAGAFRWYLLAGGILGAIAGEAVFLPVRRALTQPILLFAAAAARISRKAATKMMEQQKAHRAAQRKRKIKIGIAQKKSVKNTQKQLQKQGPVLYNSNV